MTAIVSTEIVYRHTTTAGAAGDSTAQANPNADLGKYASTSAWAGGVANDLFDDISGAENAASTSDYRGLAILNNNTANVLANAAAYISSEVAGGASVAIGADPTGSLAKGSASAQLVTIANETTAPAGVTFTSPTTYAGGVALGSIAVGFVKGLWIRRAAANSSALSADGATFTVQGDTGSL
jgi:hypothetical protein